MMESTKIPLTTLDWPALASSILKAELAKRRINYIQLQTLLTAAGLDESLANIRNKLSRGTFSAVFFLQCLKVMDAKQISLEEDYFK